MEIPFSLVQLWSRGVCKDMTGEVFCKWLWEVHGCVGVSIGVCKDRLLLLNVRRITLVNGSCRTGIHCQQVTLVTLAV